MLKKEQIKDRMLKTAARLWEIPEGEIENNFDPLLLLLLETCAGALEQLGAGINATQSRLIDRLAELILPEAMINAHPGSCIMQATPVEARAMLDETTRFYTTQRVQQAGIPAYNRDFYFTPVGNFGLLKAGLSYMKAGNRFYRFTGNGQKELLHSDGPAADSNELWLALCPDKALNSLKGLQLFFDLKGHSDAALFYSSLHNAAAFANGQELRLSPGYYKGSQFDLHLEEALSAGYSYSRKVHRTVAGIYARQFLSLNSDLQPLPGDLPDDWLSLPEKVLQGLQAEATIFIRIRLGRMFSAETLERLFCSVNAFPVVNRTLNTIHYRTDAWTNIIPMPVEGSFLDLHQITGSSGGRYTIHTSAGKPQLEEGEAIVRSSGIGKTSSREVREIVGSLMEAIRDESAYFSQMSNEFVQARLREITRILARLEDQMQIARDEKKALHYLLLKPRTAGEPVTVSYWTTLGTEAQVIRAGTPLTAFNHTLTPSQGAVVLTNVSGGRSVVSEAEKQYMLKRQLSSGGKIVSAEDVKLLSYQLFGERLRHVEVKKGIRPGEGTNQGFQRTIDIFLTLAPRHDEPAREEVGYLCRELEYNLSLYASPVCPFRLVLL